MQVLLLACCCRRLVDGRRRATGRKKLRRSLLATLSLANGAGFLRYGLYCVSRPRLSFPDGAARAADGTDHPVCLCAHVGIDPGHHALLGHRFHLGFESFALLLEGGDLVRLQIAWVLAASHARFELGPDIAQVLAELAGSATEHRHWRRLQRIVGA